MTIMPTRDTDARAVTLVDLPLVRRLVERGMVLDCEQGLIREPHGPNSPLLSSLLLQRGIYTLVARSDKEQVVGQFRLKSDDAYARLMYVAPGLEPDADDTAWLHVLDAMAREAGKQGAYALLAEVEEHQPLFETLRTAGYAVYARQEVWRRAAGTLSYHPPLQLAQATPDDTLSIQSLYHATVPRLVQQFAAPSSDMKGLVYRHGERIGGYLAYSEGRYGINIVPYLHPDVLSDAPAILESAIRQIGTTHKLPVYVCVRRYQEWVTEALAELNFEPYSQQAVMVKHITAGVRHAEFTPLSVQLQMNMKPVTRPLKPPGSRCIETGV